VIVMPETTLNTTVNPHLLARLLALAEATPVLVSDDIVDAAGFRLLVRGTRLARHHGNVLDRRTLRKLLEGSLIVPGAPDTEHIVATARHLLATNLPLARIVDTVSGRGELPLALLETMDFGHAMRLMLALVSHQHAAALDHCVTVSLLAICMAKKLHLSEEDQHAAGLAGLLHDIGELHLDPACLVQSKRLSAHEWAQQVAHPRIGQMLIDQLASYSLSVGRAVGEHHERFDGSGYPRHARGHNISAPGQAVSVAEMIAALLYKDHPLERAELALRIVPGEHAPDLLPAISCALRAQGKASPSDHPGGFDSEADQRLYWRISSAIESGRNLLDGGAADAPQHRELLTRALERISTILRAFLATSGIDKNVIRAEVQWRLRDIARDMALQTAGAANQRSVFAGLIQLLDDGPATVVPDDCANADAVSAGLAQAGSPASRPFLM
jgi:hypothetical protein